MDALFDIAIVAAVVAGGVGFLEAVIWIHEARSGEGEVAGVPAGGDRELPPSRMEHAGPCSPPVRDAAHSVTTRPGAEVRRARDSRSSR
jgi:hypothetical protein